MLAAMFHKHAASYQMLILPIWLLALASMVHLIQTPDRGEYLWLHNGLLLCSFALLLKPQSLFWLICFCIMQWVRFFTYWHFPSNSGMMVCVASLVLLVGFVAARSQCSDIKQIKEAMALSCLPALRFLLIILYFYGIFHKINVDWFDPQISCALDLWHRLHLPYFSTLTRYNWIALSIIWAPLLLEAAFIVGLFSKGWMKRFSIIGGILFHMVIGFSSFREYWAFSTLVFALYACFLPPNAYRDWRLLLRYMHRLGMRLLPRVLLVIAVIGVGFAADDARKWQHMDILMLIWGLFSFGFLAFCWHATRHYARRVSLSEAGAAEEDVLTPSPKRGYWSIPSVSVALVVLGFFLHCALPYTGIKSAATLNMFSNLYTAGGVSNHYIMKVHWQFMPWEEQLAYLINPSNRWLKRQADPHSRAIHFRNLLKYLRRWPDVTVSFFYRGHYYENVNYAQLAESYSLWPPLLDSFFSYTRADPLGFTECN
jgi:hypothetical protein